jgi:hypothetical protein
MIVTSPAVIRTYAAADTGRSCRLALGALEATPRGAALRRDGDRFGAGSHGPPHNLDGISSGTFAPALSTPAPTPSRRPMR